MQFIDHITQAESQAVSLVEEARVHAQVTLERAQKEQNSIFENAKLEMQSKRADALRGQKEELKRLYKEVFAQETKSLEHLERSVSRSRTAAVAYLLERL